jgi:5-methyltetrahydrofolate--homocysteine methyltransferase
METLLTSPTEEVRIGPDHPFVIIGERINPTGRKRLAAEMAAGNYDRVRKDALAQVAAGAHVLDVNAGIPLADEPAILAEAIRIVQSVVDVPLSIDSSIVKALEAGLAAYQGKPLVNSVTGEEERLEVVLPLVAQYKAAVIGISNDETGISEDPDVRIAIAKKIVERAESYGIPRADVLIDPLAMPVGAVRYAGATLFKIVRRVREELGVNTICGASNISFGLPDRPTLNAAFIAMAIATGMTCAITNPLEPEIQKIILAADVMMGHDENCSAWLKAHRAGAAREGGGEAAAGRAARRERRRTESAS